MTFLGLFIYFYKTSGKFRKPIITTFMAAIVVSSGLTTARAAGEADAFTPQPQHQSRPSHRSRLGSFSGRSSNDGLGPDKPDDFDSDSVGDGLPQFPQVESIEKPEERAENIETLIRRMEEDSDTKSEEDQCYQQNKSGINELPGSPKFIYNLGTKTAKKIVKRVWKNFEARKEIISNLEKVDRGDLLPRNEK